MSEGKEAIDMVTVPYEALDILWSVAMRHFDDEGREDSPADSLLRQALCDAAKAMRGTEDE